MSCDGDDTTVRRRRVLEVEAENRHCHRLRAPGVRALIMQVNGGKAPVWSSITKAFTVSEGTSANVVALAEHLGYHVVMTGPRAVRSMPVGDDTAPTHGGLW